MPCKGGRCILSILALCSDCPAVRSPRGSKGTGHRLKRQFLIAQDRIQHSGGPACRDLIGRMVRLSKPGERPLTIE